MLGPFRLLAVFDVVAALLALLMWVAELVGWLVQLPSLRRLERHWHAIPQERWITLASIPLATVLGGVLLSYGVNLLSDADGGRDLPGFFWVLLGLGFTAWYYTRQAAGAFQRPTPKARNRGLIADAAATLARRPPPDLRSREALRVALLRVNRLGGRLAASDDGGWREAWRRERRWLAVLVTVVVGAPVLTLGLIAWRAVGGPTTEGLVGLVAVLAGIPGAALLAMGSRRYRLRRERRLLGRELQQASADLLGRLFDPTRGERVPAPVLAEIAETLCRVYGPGHRPDPTAADRGGGRHAGPVP
ncbi:hypothetical protein [Micromonospora sagamiensis]|uniref:Uncharacterized protein n=1 Tax=Micromonospora sagamiensis TaxID=47875 RepID=A0A562WHK6_9ACTN|nr:hypothetical protein [Micromonospora sagamiensis]TWJ29501.1 hypothetical protein JD81_03011 [Micromonospora sagamiensis]BCL17471.1 hypothetical protein GCM10017556_52100 [Micromonospora sagamiensis]